MPRRRPVSVIVFAILLLLAIWLVPSTLLLIFAGVLLAVFLRGGGDLLFRRFGVPGAARVLLFTLLLLLLLAAFIVLAAAPLAEQANQLWQQVPRMVSALEQRLSSYSWGQQLLERAQPENLSLPQGGGSSAFAALGSTFGMLGNAVLLLFLGLYFAVDPGLYRRGIKAFFAPSLRPKAEAMCQEVAQTLRGWLAAQMISMAAVGVLTTLGLWLLEVPLAVLLGLLAALLTFIPTIGPVLAAVPAVLLGLESGLTGAASVILLTLAVQSVESYLITPFVQKRSVEMPQAMTIIALVAMGSLFGLLGMALATPLVAMVMTLTRRLYVEDYLDQERPEEGAVVLRPPGARG